MRWLTVVVIANLVMMMVWQFDSRTQCGFFRSLSSKSLRLASVKGMLGCVDIFLFWGPRKGVGISVGARVLALTLALTLVLVPLNRCSVN